MGASVVVFNFLTEPQVLETLAIREALALAGDLYTPKISIASDCKVPVDAIKEGSNANFGAIVHEIVARAKDFLVCSFSHEFRTSNREAHNFAKFTLSRGFGRHVWLGQPGDLVFAPVNIEMP
jgi:hypothetical protein